MENKNLRQSLENLHRKLKSTEVVDDKSKEVLYNLMQDIERLLDKPLEKSKDEQKDLFDNLKDSVEYFEASHPELTAVINNVINVFVNIGI